MKMKDHWIHCERCKDRWEKSPKNKFQYAELWKAYEYGGAAVGNRDVGIERGNGHIMVNSRVGPVALCLTDARG
jgi:hypothetical protein